MSDIKHRRCPDCGDADHLRASAEAKWDPVASAWIITEWTEGGVECTTCDWAGPVEETEFHEGAVKALSSDGEA